MTGLQYMWLKAISATATVIVLGAGASWGGPSAAFLAALNTPVVAPAPKETKESVADSGAGPHFDSSFSDDAGGRPPQVAVAPAPAQPTPAEPEEADTEEPVIEPPAKPEAKASKIKHVFVIALAGHGYDATFGEESQAAYLNDELRPKGTLLENYSSLGPEDMPDYIAMVGGQAPTDDIRAGCPTYKEKTCVFPNTVTTIGDQITASGQTWRAYIEDLDRGTPPTTACRRPDSNAADDTATARPGDGYATRHNPFVYYHSLLDLGDCDANDGPLDRLADDLGSEVTTPNYSFIAPNLCHDGTESPCIDGSAGGLPAADAFLAEWVPKILRSKAYENDGLLIVTFAGGEDARNGTLLVSRYATPGATAGVEYDPYSLLRSVEDLFAFAPLAKAKKAQSFADTVLAAASNEQLAD